MPEHATGSRAAKGNLVSRIDAQLPKRLTPEADLYVDAADGGPHATPDRAALERIVEDREADVREFEERLLFVRRRLMAAKLDLAVARDAEQGIDHA